MYHQEALQPAKLFPYPTEDRFSDTYRRWQGIPSIAVSPKGRIFVNFYTGQAAEVGGNIMLLCTSDDHGKSFRNTLVAEHPHPECRLYDPALWLDPHGRMWIFWAQAHGFHDARSGVWCSICEDPDASVLQFGVPRRIANGIMINKPIVTKDNAWLFPCCLWHDGCGAPPTEDHGLDSEKYSNVYVSYDNGKTISYLGSADVPQRSFDESMIVEKKDGTLWMLVRTFYGIGESFSHDGGKTWAPGKPSHIEGPCSRFHISRLKSGRLLMINHYHFTERIDLDDIMSQGNVKSWKGRSHLTAMLSEDDGASWPYTLLLDERNEVSYPDAAEGEDGYIYVTYDWQRVKQREILMARFTEKEILHGKIEDQASRLRILVNKALGQPDVN